jgi:RNA polymerase sigma-70 factor (ECF subfamily)
LDPKQDNHLAELLVSAQNGNNHDYALFLSEVTKLLRPYLVRRMTIEQVEDVLQETLITIHQARHTYLPSRKVGPWLYALCNHRMIDHFRKYRRVQKNETLDFEAIEAMPDSQPQEIEHHNLERTVELLGKLPAEQQSIIKMLKLEDLSVKEVSERTGLSESNVKVTAFRGYQTIRRWLRIDSNENE